MSLFLWRLHCLRPSLLSLDLSTPFASSIYRLLSTTTTSTSNQASAPNPRFAVEYLIQSCGLSSDEAVRASKNIQHLKSHDKPDAVLRFLRQTGLSESDIRTAVSRNSRLLCSHVENNLKPNVAKLQELGFSHEDISGTISRSPNLFTFNIVRKVDFWMRALGSIENVSYVISRQGMLLHSSLEKTVISNLSFFQEQCSLSVRQIVQMIKSAPRLFSCKPETLKIYAKRAEQFQIPISSSKFVRALIVVCNLKQSTVDARKHHLESLGLSKEEVTLMISNDPQVLKVTNELLSRKMEFLMNETRCNKRNVVRKPKLLMLSFEKRLVPRSLFWKLLESKGLLSANSGFISFVNLSENDFMEKFVLPYEHAIPGLHQAYADACAGKIGAFDLLMT